MSGSVLFLISFLPVIVVWFEHKSVSYCEHGIANPPNENCEWDDEPILPDGTADNSDENCNC